MSKEDVINYVMTTPSNPNRAVLSGMLDGISGTQLPSPTESDNGKVLGVDGGEYKLVEQSGGGYSCTESTSLLFEETVTTASEEASTPMARGMLDYAEQITADELIVTLNGTKYVCPRQGNGLISLYGATEDEDVGIDFSDYPFAILSINQMGSIVNTLMTPQAGTYSIKGESVDETIETTPCFSKAVASANPPLFIKYARTDGTDTIFDKTDKEVQDAIKANRTVILCLGETYTDTNVNRFYLLKSYFTQPSAYHFDGENLDVNDKGELFIHKIN